MIFPTQGLNSGWLRCIDIKGTGTNIISTSIPEAASLINTTSYRLLPPPTGSGPPPSPPVPVRVQVYHHLCSPGHTARRTSQCIRVPQIHFLFFFEIEMRKEMGERPAVDPWAEYGITLWGNSSFLISKHKLTMVPTIIRFNEVKYTWYNCPRVWLKSEQVWLLIIIIIFVLLSCNNNNIMSDIRTWWWE